MIVEFYPSEKRKQHGELKKSVFVYTSNSPTIAEKCAKLNITAAEYWKRKNLVTAEVKKLGFKVGDYAYPSRWKDFKQHGQVRIAGVCYDYDHYGEVEWNDPPFILAVRSTGPGESQMINCTIGWVTKEAPANPQAKGEC